MMIVTVDEDEVQLMTGMASAHPKSASDPVLLTG